MPTWTGSTGDDNIQLGGGPWTVDGDTGDDVIVTDTSVAHNDTIDGGTGADVMRGNFGDDVYSVDDIGDIVVEANVGGGLDTIYATVSYTLSNNVEVLYMVGSETGIGNSGTNTIFGDTGNNVINGAGGADIMDGGGDGDDTFYIDNAGDVIQNVGLLANVVNTVFSTLAVDLTAGVFVDFTNATLVGSASVDITGNAAANYLVGNAGVNTITAGDGADSLDGGAGADRLIGGLGDDAYFIDNVNDRITELALEGMDTVFSSVSVNLGLAAFANLENLILTGTANINGTAGNTGNAIQGNAGKNTITGGASDDILSGGLNGAAAGGDRLVGGAGNDRYTVQNAADVVIESAGGGIDEITAYTSFNLSAAALAAQEIENLTLAGPDALNGTGNARANVIIGNGLDNTLDGGKNTVGFDTLVGGDGDDTYIIHNSNDFIDEIVDQGIDTVKADFTYTLTTFVENLVLTGTGNFDGFGNVADNTLTGNNGANTLDGLAGADTMIGGTGNDTYFVEDIGDVVSENANAGIDTVQSTIGYTLQDNIESLVLLGTGDIDGTGNALNNTITGNSGNNTLDGGAGADRLIGGLGNDTYIVDSLSDVILDTGGNDTVQSTVNVNLASIQYSGIENATLGGTGNTTAVGNIAVNILTGNDGNNLLDGGAGNDTMAGGAGDDTFVVDAAGDVVIENASEGNDTVRSSVTYTLTANVENLVLTDATAINGTGNAEDNTLTGNSAANVLAGGLGDDTYIVDALDTIVEAGGEGTDTAIFTSAVVGDLYTLGSNIENLVLGGTTAINGTGDGGDNTITGNIAVNILNGGNGNDVLDGSAGADTMIGGAGDDVYFVNMTTDVVSEAAASGNDTVNASVTYVLSGNVENLTLTGAAAINGTGDAGANTIIGNAAKNILTGLSGDDVLDGGAGADTMIGGEGSDTYIVDNIGDKVTETGTLGTDSVETSVSFTLAAGIENLVLTGTGDINGTGNSLDNVIDGNDGNNTLDGGAGNDILGGGLGDDTYILDSAGDIVAESGGNDTIRVGFTASLASYTGIDNIVLTGTSAINATGDAGNNTLTGNSAVNTLTGGDGDDTYIAGMNDVIVELDGGGNDTLIITLTGGGTFVLPDFVENIVINGTGGTLSGNGDDNTFGGNAGNNTLDGGGGVDTLSGAGGNDTYIVDNAGDIIVELAGDGTDTVRATANYTLSANVENLILLGTGSINGTGNNLDNTITGNSGNNTLDGGTGTDKLIGGAGNDTYVVDNLSDLIVDAAGNDTVSTGITYTLKPGLENLTLTGTADVNGTGNTVVNIMTGNTGANTLDGGAANDTLNGGDGNDVLIGGLGADIMTGGIGNDDYRVDNVNDRIVELTGEGTDSLTVTVNYTLSATADIENITLGGTTGLRFTGSDSDNTVTGNSGANFIDGGSGADMLSGGAGNDSLVGGLGDDILNGGLGIDRMTGGAGADTFVFDSAIASTNAYVVTDFNALEDKIDISALMTDFDPLTDILSNWVEITVGGVLKVNTAGTGFGAGTGYTTVATFLGNNGLTGEQQLVDDGILIIA
jgi:Ca2+-binding RTX toxin-like protein